MIPGNVGHVPRRNLDETCAAFAGRSRPQSPVLTEVEPDLTALLVQNREDAGLAVASKVILRKLDGYSRLGELVGGQQIGSCSGSEKTPTDETKVAFACIRILQNQRVITSMMREYVAAHSVDSDGLLEFSDVD
jgi:hypothetical protein